MNELQKSIKYTINRAIGWRTELQPKFPDDPRNPLAVELLTQFSEDVDNMTPDQLGKVAPYFSWIDEHWHIKLRNAVRRVGYQRTIKTFDGFLSALVSDIQKAKVAA
jgi:hypothetical protein